MQNLESVILEDYDELEPTSARETSKSNLIEHFYDPDNHDNRKDKPPDSLIEGSVKLDRFQFSHPKHILAATTCFFTIQALQGASTQILLMEAQSEIGFSTLEYAILIGSKGLVDISITPLTAYIGTRHAPYKICGYLTLFSSLNYIICSLCQSFYALLIFNFLGVFLWVVQYYYIHY
eukprot:UN30687